MMPTKKKTTDAIVVLAMRLGLTLTLEAFSLHQLGTVMAITKLNLNTSTTRR
jgi:hypothetical protein